MPGNPRAIRTALDESRLDGGLLLPGEPGYDGARAVWNAMVDRRPGVIVRCASVRDVVSAVRAARELDLEIGVRSGGHGVLGLAVPDGGLMIDLTLMGAARVDPERRHAIVQGGAVLSALDAEAQRYGLATTAGNVSHTGVGGLALGGGMGWLARQYGLTCDNAVSFELVTAKGDVLRASATEHPELFWGLRGGGGNFGVVTEFEFLLHPIAGHALVALYTFPPEVALPVLRRWGDGAAEAPREATFTAGVSDEGATVGAIWVGDPDAGRRLLPGLRALGSPIARRELEMSYLELQRIEDEIERHAVRRFSKGHYLRRFPDEAIEAFLLRGSPDGRGDGLPNVGLQAHGGAIAEVGNTDTAFSHRDTLFEFGTSIGWTDPADDEPRMAAARRSAAAIEPFASGVYVNALSDDGAEGVRRAYPPEQLKRLTALKDAFDPDNAFHLNPNITPTPQPSA